MAGARDCCHACSGRKPVHYNRNFFYHKAVLCFRLLPKNQNSAHVVENARSDLHPRNQLDFDGPMFGCHYRFSRHKRLGNASGLAVITVMLVTTCLMSLVIVLCWHHNVLLAICFVLFFGMIEALYFSASLIMFLEGAWMPIALALIFVMVMFVWHYGTLKKYEFDVQNKVSVDWLLGLGPTLGIVRVRGIGLIHTELVSGIPAIFSHFVTTSRPSTRSSSSFASSRSRSRKSATRSGSSSAASARASTASTAASVRLPRCPQGEELRDLMDAREAGVAYILGHSYVRANKGSSLMKKMVINCGYDFFRRNCRSSSYGLSSPHSSTLEVGMVYHV